VEKRKDKAGKEFDFEYLVAMKDGKPVAVDPDDEKNAVFSDLLVNTEINGIKVKSPLQLISEEVNRKTLDQWAKLCGISKKDIEEVAKDLTSHGKKACVDVHGACPSTQTVFTMSFWPGRSISCWAITTGRGA
jgi:tetrathionate reductase subunit A